MTISVITSSSYKVNSQNVNVASVTITGVPTSGSDRMIIVSSTITSGSTTANSVSRGSETFTEIGGSAVSATLINCSLWVCDSEPATASTDITVTNTGTDRPSAASALVMSGVDQTTPVGTRGTDSGDGATSSSASISGGDLTVDVLGTQGGSSSGTTAPGGSQTLEIDNEAASDFDTRPDNYMSYGAVSTMTWSWTTSVNYAQIAVPVNASTGGINVNESESVTVGEDKTVDVQTYVVESESVGASDVPSVDVQVDVSETDPVGVTDSATVDVAIFVNVNETVTVVSTNTTVDVIIEVNETDPVGVADDPTVAVESALAPLEILISRDDITKWKRGVKISRV